MATFKEGQWVNNNGLKKKILSIGKDKKGKDLYILEWTDAESGDQLTSQAYASEMSELGDKRFK